MSSGARKWRRRLLLTASGVTLALLLLILWWKFAPPGDPGGPPDAAWCQKVRKFPPRDRMRIVLDKLADLNPGFNHDLAEWNKPEVIELELSTDNLRDIRPLTALGELKALSLTGSKTDAGQLADLSPLEGLKLLRLTLARNANLRELAPLHKMPLFKLDLADTAVFSLEDLVDSQLMHLNIARTSIKDLTPLRLLGGLRYLDCTGCPIESLAPVTDVGLEELRVDFRPIRDTPILKRMSTLRTMNDVPVKEFLKKL